MKKVVICLLFVLAVSPVSFLQGNPIPVTCIDEPNATINIEVTLGSRKKECKGFGICEIHFDFDLRPGPGSAKGKAWIENGKLKLLLDRSSIEAGTYNTYFAENLLIIEEDYNIPTEISSRLDIESYVIRSGNYTIQQTENGTKILISL